MKRNDHGEPVTTISGVYAGNLDPVDPLLLPMKPTGGLVS
jgi:hypothetical protein